MQKPSRAINVHLGTELKARWVAYCEGMNKSPGAALKEAIEQQLTKAEGHPEPKKYHQAGYAKESKQRFEILLTASEKAAIKERSTTERCSMRRWIVDAIRAGLSHEPQFSMSEVDALGESNYHLLLLGRNLNQIARRLNEGHREPVTVQRIEALSRLIEKHTDVVSDAMAASLERWQLI